MKTLLACVPFLCLLPLTSALREPATPAPAQEALEARVSALEGELAAEKGRLEETRALLEETVAYLAKQGEASKKLLGVLDESETAGFTKGINYPSREILLAGFRAYWGGLEKGLPKLPAAADKTKAGPAAPARRPRQ